MARLFGGIDPGKDGAVVLVDDRSVPIQGFLMPLIDKYIDPGTFFRMLKRETDGHDVTFFLEKAHAFPGQGVVSMFNYGVSFGFMEMAVASLGLSYNLIQPKEWQKEMFKGTDSKMDAKDRAEVVARRLLLGDDFLIPGARKKPHKGLVDAYLMAVYCLRKSIGGIAA